MGNTAITPASAHVEEPMEHPPWTQVGRPAPHATISITWSTVNRFTLRTVMPLMRVTASIAGGLHIALTAGQYATHQVGESSADGTITANPRTPETPDNQGH